MESFPSWKSRAAKKSFCNLDGNHLCHPFIDQTNPNWVVVSKIFYFHPLFGDDSLIWGRFPVGWNGLRLHPKMMDLWKIPTKNWMGPNPNGPRSVSCDRAINILRFFGGPFRNGPVGDFFESSAFDFVHFVHQQFGRPDVFLHGVFFAEMFFKHLVW